MKCPNCNKLNNLKITIPLKGIRHQDFEIIDQNSKSVVLNQCQTCFHIFKKYSPEKIKSLENYLKSKSYKNKMFANICSATNLKGNSREEGQVLLIKKIFKNNQIKKGNFLDFGCNRGDLVGEVKKILDKKFIDFYGLDSECPQNFKTISNNSFFIQKLSEFPDHSASIIVISHTLIYVENHIKLLKDLKKKLNQDGILLIQNPHPLRSSNYLLDDQFHFFQESSLKYALSELGFSCYSPSSSNKDVEIVIIGSPKTIRGFDLKKISELNYVKLTEIKENIIKTIKKVNTFCSRNYCYVLGTTSAGALIAQILDKNFKQAIDENWIDKKSQFYDKSVLQSIKNLSFQSKLIIPIYRRSNQVKDRILSQNSKLDILPIDNI